ncbi:hypothetical protein PsYK624_141170 [Phanerochaete sordida]|uniref:F-box domain-containing protein n=1 Tax=Phanerochaete sordida TaxID=48140 RepID=A0A9P3GM58_9APHY|nr:hypothetical protein PsYK624_141170 [Phanerochaete sordida]
MHRCLAIPEIVGEIVHSLPPCDDERHSSYREGPRADLAGLARVSRVFYEPAMDMVWARLDSLAPLMFCLPPHLVWIRESEGLKIVEADLALTCSEPPSTSDRWARFASYASRIRKLCLHNLVYVMDPALERAFLAFFRDHYSGRFFPRLRELDIQLGLDFYNAARRAEQFLQNCLVALRVRDADTSKNTSVFFATLSSVPHLQQLEVNYHYDSRELAGEVSAMVRALDGLRHLGGDPHCLSIDALAHLSGLHGFNTLSLRATRDNISISESPFSGGFAFLTTLRIEFTYGIPLAQWASFLGAFSSAPVQSLRLTVRDGALEDETTPTELLPALDALGAFTVLRACEIEFDLDRDADLWHGDFLDSTALHALFRVPTVRELTLLGCPLSFAPPFVREMAEAWPHLEVVRLYAVKSVDESVDESEYEGAAMSEDDSEDERVYKSPQESADEIQNESADESTDESSRKSSDESSDASTDKETDGSPGENTDGSANEIADEITDGIESADEGANESADESADESTDESANENAGGASALCVPLTDLVHLARHCPHLAAIDISLEDVSKHWTWAEQPDVSPSHARRLLLAFAPIAREAAPALARFLDRYFPNAAIDYDREQHVGSWPFLNRCMPDDADKMLQAVEELRLTRA